MLFSAFLLLGVAFPSLVFSGKGDRDTQIGQVPLKDSPVSALNNVTLTLIDLSKDKGCVGQNCVSHIYSAGDHRQLVNSYWDGTMNSDEVDECMFPKDYGDCERAKVRWYFDTRIEACRRFLYSGCGGNTNNFRSRGRCQRECDSYEIESREDYEDTKDEAEVIHDVGSGSSSGDGYQHRGTGRNRNRGGRRRSWTSRGGVKSDGSGKNGSKAEIRRTYVVEESRNERI